MFDIGYRPWGKSILIDMSTSSDTTVPDSEERLTEIRTFIEGVLKAIVENPA